MSRRQPVAGELALLLHSHMPYVEGFGTWPFGEEWLFEATAAAYLPLIEQCHRWLEQGMRNVLTLGITPVLADQLALPEVGARLLRFLRQTRAECHRLDIDGLERGGQPQAADALRQSALDYKQAAERFESLRGDLLGALRELRDSGVIELWPSAATHPVLPLLATEAGIRLQLQTGIASHRARFGGWSGGFWLPECGFRSGIEEQLSQAGVRAFCVDQTADGDALDQLEPAACEGAAVAVPIDWRTISLVWDERGYPADPVYRDYHAPSMNGLRPWANSGRPYDAAVAARRAIEHGHDFVGCVIERLEEYRAARGRAGLLVCALDTELLGHWWYEGPLWLASVVEHAERAGVALTTLPEALERHEPRKRRLRESSWGKGKDLTTWDSPVVAELVWPARKAEIALVAALARTGGQRQASEAAGDDAPSAAAGSAAAAERATRELLALQSSDWAFMATRRLAADYPHERVRRHSEAFERALASIGGGMTDSREMRPDARDARLRGLAPDLRLSALLEPTSPWARPGWGGG